MKKRLLRALLIVPMLFSMAMTTSVSAADDSLPFTDVEPGKWYTEAVTYAYNNGLMTGKGNGKFQPTANMTRAEAVTILARLAQFDDAALEAYVNDSDFVDVEKGENKKWYAAAVGWAVHYGVVNGYPVDGGYEFRPNADVKRAELAKMIVEFLNNDAFSFKKIDSEALLDRFEDRLSFQDWAKPYIDRVRRWGLFGGDANGNFNPKKTASRAEIATILMRFPAYDGSAEEEPALQVESLGAAYTVIDDTANDRNYTPYGNTANGWMLDNRGGVERSTTGDYAYLQDISDTAGTAMIRDINVLDEGTFTLNITHIVFTEGFNGASIELRNTDDDVVYKLMTENNSWVYDGSEKQVLCENANTISSFNFRIVISLADNTAQTYLNGQDLGTFPLKTTGEASVLSELRLATSDAEKLTYSWACVYMTANYAIDTDFLYYDIDGALPYGWTADCETSIINDCLIMKKGNVQAVSPKKVGHKAVVETKFILPGDDTQIAVMLYGGTSEVAQFYSKNGNFYFEDTLVYENYVPDLWYRLRVIFDFANGEAEVRVNGRAVATVKLIDNYTYIDKVKFVNYSDVEVKFDELQLFEKVLADDYVSAPVKPEGEENYTVGINVCPLWTYYGWQTTTAQSDIEPVLGFYDEGSPETADWEIKYLVEHGVDFQAFCWYAPSDIGTNPAPIKEATMESHLMDGYMNAEYSDQMKYCIIWEAANAGRPADMESWQKYFVPYFIENFFKDDRYLVLDNRPVLAVFGTYNLTNSKQMFEYLEEEAKRIGFDGVVFLACHTKESTSKGYDAYFAYNWGTDGSSSDVNISHNTYHLERYQSGSIYTLPTISVGFNSIVWHGTRYPLMTYEDFATTNEWVRDNYFQKQLPKGLKWAENLVMLSTWNEYGEGTYIMPSVEGGFGYLDVIRNTYTDAGIDESINIVPTESQKARITRKYPQNVRLLLPNDTLDEELDAEKNFIYIDGQQVTLSVNYGVLDSGTRLYSFEPKMLVDQLLKVYWEWDYDTKTLTLSSANHTLVYIIGSNKYTLDGEEKELGYTMYLKDGLPMLSYEQVAADLGYGFEYSDGVPCVMRQGYTGSAVSDPGEWEFSSVSEITNFVFTRLYSLVDTSESYLNVKSVSDDTSDPLITITSDAGLNTEEYTKLQIRCRFYNTADDTAQFFFTTTEYPSMSEQTSCRFKLEADNAGEWVILEYDLSTLSTWKGMVKDLRFDPFAGAGEMDIDYIRFIKDED